MRNSRPLVLGLAGAAVAGVLLWLLLGRGASDRDAPAGPHAPHDQARAPAQPEPAPALPPAQTPGAEAEADHGHGHAHGDLDRGDELADELAETTAELPAPPGEDEIAARPEQQALTPEEQRARRQASIDLLDRHIDRLEAEQKAAEASGDTRTAERNRIRVARMRQRRAALAAEP